MDFDSMPSPTILWARAAVTVVGCILCVLLSIGLGWFGLWYLVLHRTFSFKDMMGLNK